MMTTRPCRSCGASVHIRARGECDSCYAWHARHGWEKVRPAQAQACRVCSRVWHACGGHNARGMCQRCYKREIRSTTI
jgi:NMD protein affecting ribosome stability and mRNA decay